MRHKILEKMTPEWKACYEAGIFTEFMEQRGPGHTAGGDKYYKMGFLDIKEQIKEAISKLDYLNDDEALDKKEQLDAMDIACDAIMIYGKRYSEYAAKLAQKEADPVRKKNLWKYLKCVVGCQLMLQEPLEKQFKCTGLFIYV